MPSDNNNSIPDLVCLKARSLKPNDPDADEELRVELSIHPAPLDAIDKLNFEVGLTKLTLSLDLSGVDIVPGSKHGEPIKPIEVIRTETITDETVVVGKTGAKGGLKIGLTADAGLSFDADASGSLSKKATVTHNETKTHIYVKAKGNDTWDITEPVWEKVQTLAGKYLNDHHICRITRHDRSNNRTVELKAYAKQRDLTFTPKERTLGTILASQDKLLSILLAKALAKESPFQGFITLSKSVIELED